MPAPAVLVHDLVKRYDGRAVVDGVSLTAERGAITAVLGPNGAGKTTTVECCEGLRSPDAGRVEVLGLHPLTDARELRPRVGVMLQDGGLPTGVRALEMLRHVASMYARPRDVGELTERLGLESFARTTVRRLSGGQRQRLALAAAIVGRPEVVFLDEPSAGMDPQAGTPSGSSCANCARRGSGSSSRRTSWTRRRTSRTRCTSSTTGR